MTFRSCFLASFVEFHPAISEKSKMWKFTPDDELLVRQIAHTSLQLRWANKTATLLSDWLRHFRLLCNHWTEFNEARSQHPWRIVFFGPSEKKKTSWQPWPLIGRYTFDFFLSTTERNSTKLHRKQNLNVFYRVRVLRADRKTGMAALVSDWARHF